MRLTQKITLELTREELDLIRSALINVSGGTEEVTFKMASLANEIDMALKP